MLYRIYNTMKYAILGLGLAPLQRINIQLILNYFDISIILDRSNLTSVYNIIKRL